MNAGPAGACFVYTKLVKLSRPFKLACAKGTITKSVFLGPSDLALINLESGAAVFQMKRLMRMQGGTSVKSGGFEAGGPGVSSYHRLDTSQNTSELVVKLCSH